MIKPNHSNSIGTIGAINHMPTNQIYSSKKEITTNIRGHKTKSMQKKLTKPILRHIQLISKKSIRKKRLGLYPTVWYIVQVNYNLLIYLHNNCLHINMGDVQRDILSICKTINPSILKPPWHHKMRFENLRHWNWFTFQP